MKKTLINTVVVPYLRGIDTFLDISLRNALGSKHLCSTLPKRN